VRAVRAWAHSVHVEVDGLAPGGEYHYRFRAEGHVSPAGRTRTAPAAGSSPDALTLAVASCADYEHGFFTGYRRLAEDDPDLVLHLGDYLYELGPDDYVAWPGNVRQHLGHETRTLADYRQRHAQYKTDPDLQHAHAAVPWSVVFDDHEIDANWAADVPQVPQRHFARRRAAAFRAYYEHMPLRRTSLPRGADMRVHRRLRWGDLATIHLLDTRQYRADQACGDTRVVGCAARLDPRRSILGDRQERWLLDGLSSSRGTWDLLAQQVFFAQKDSRPGPEHEFAMDGWDGYAASRRRLLAGLVDRGVRNPVVLTGDVHRHYANDLRLDFDDPSTRPVGVELVTTSITSGGDGRDRTPVTDVQLAENPHLRFANSRRGYVLARLERDHLRADFKTLGYVRKPGAPASVAASFVVEEGRPGLRRV
jgi:alkaline phosphatase D